MQVDSKVGKETGARDRDMTDHEVIVWMLIENYSGCEGSDGKEN